MEFQRRIAQGRLSEIVGAQGPEGGSLAAHDRPAGRAGSVAEGRGRARALIEAYVAGINTFLATHQGGSLPVEFAILRTSPTRGGEDVVASQKSLAWQLSANWRDELLRLRISARVGDEGQPIDARVHAERSGHPPARRRCPSRAVTPAAPRRPAPPADRAGPRRTTSRRWPPSSDTLTSRRHSRAAATTGWCRARVDHGQAAAGQRSALGRTGARVWYLAHVTGGAARRDWRHAARRARAC